MKHWLFLLLLIPALAFASGYKDANSDKLHNSGFTGFDNLADDVTITGWVKFDNAAGVNYEEIIHTKGTDNHIVLSRNHLESLCLWTVHGASGWQSACSSNGFADDTDWHFFAIRYDSDGTGGVYYWYWDNTTTEIATKTHTLEPGGAVDTMGIGTRAEIGTDWGVIGYLAHVRFWNTLLTTGELATEKDSCNASKTASLLSEYRFASGALATDSYGSNDLTSTTGTVYSSTEPPPCDSDVAIELYRRRGR